MEQFIDEKLKKKSTKHDGNIKIQECKIDDIEYHNHEIHHSKNDEKQKLIKQSNIVVVQEHESNNLHQN